MTCKHVHANFTMRDEPNTVFGCYAVWLGPVAPTAMRFRADFGYSPGRVVSARCYACGAQLALGPSNDAGCEVEMRSAELISRRASGDPMMFERLEQRGHHGIVLEDGEEFLASWQAGFALMEWICCDDDRPEKSDPSTKFGDARRRWW